MVAGNGLPDTGRVVLSITDMDKTEPMAAAMRDLVALGFKLATTKDTGLWLGAERIASTPVNKGTKAASDTRDIRRVARMDKPRISQRLRRVLPRWPR